MPLYEYQCTPCDHTFETLIRNPGDVARCPRCGTVNVFKLMSVPAMAHVGAARAGELPMRSEPIGASSFGCGRPQCGSGMCAGLD